MKVWGALVNFFGIVVCIYMLVFASNTLETNKRQFDELRLRYAMDYATEAGFRAALATDDLGIDYSDMTDVEVSPQLALDTFDAVMCINYNMSPSAENKAMIESYMPTAIMVCSDGFYTAKLTEYDYDYYDNVFGHGFKLQWGLKRPYMNKINLAGARDAHLAYSLKGVPLYVSYYDVDNALITLPIMEEERILYNNGVDLSSINTSIVNEANLAIRKKNENFTSTVTDAQMFYLPQEFSTVANNAVETPSFLTMLQNVTFAGSSKLQAMSVGGAKITVSRQVVGFQEKDAGGNYHSYYCYNYQLPSTVAAGQYFSTIDEAARAGYHPHLAYMTSTENTIE